ncbi:MAG: hypothetical protein R3281_13800, partial [Balneolaceae bacterium]|nr:hypothetical protein [Balneolaceae bacterium]
GEGAGGRAGGRAASPVDAGLAAGQPLVGRRIPHPQPHHPVPIRQRQVRVQHLRRELECARANEDREGHRHSAQHRQCRTSTIQLVDYVDGITHRTLKERLPGVTIVQVIHVVDEFAIQQSVDAAATADALLLDSGNPRLEVKKLGGTGTTHNWNLSREIVRMVVETGIPCGRAFTREHIERNTVC